MENEKVDVNEAKIYAKQHNASWFLTSAKDNMNIYNCYINLSKG